MLTDAHCHPFDLNKVFPGAEEERRRLGVLCAASASDREEFEYNEALSQKAKSEGAALLLPCFAVPPPLPAFFLKASENHYGAREPCVSPCEVIRTNIALLEELAEQGRLAAVGETGFDLYNENFRKTEKIQEELFALHLETALAFDLPLVLHIRRAMHKVFALDKLLRKCRAVIFHSWPGTLGEGESLLKRGINAYFSFGTTIMLNHRETMRCCAAFPAQRLLLETDAPYQPLRALRTPRAVSQAQAYSSWEDMPLILRTAAELRREAGAAGSQAAELEEIVEENFRTAFDR
jgi:TatD DNase family protein